MTHTKKNNTNRDFKTVAVWSGVVALILFCVFVVFYERHDRKEAYAKLDEHARVVADALWNYNHETASEYLKLACQSYNYTSLQVIEENGRVFFEAAGKKLHYFERLLKSANLMPGTPLESDILYEGERIGHITVSWHSRAIYAHGAVFVFLLMGTAVFLLYVRTFQAKQTLEMRVHERTSAIAAANASLQEEIRHREHVENELRANEENLSTTLDSIGDAVIATDTAGKIVRMNPVGQRLTGWTIEKAKGKPLSHVFYIIDSNTREKITDPVKQVLNAGRVVTLTDQTVLVASDGQEYQVADSGAPIRDKNGVITGVVLVFRDVTEEYRIREALRESEKQLRNAQSVAGMGSFQLDLDTGKVTISPEGCKIYDISECRELFIREVARIPLPEYRQMLAEKLETVVNGEEREYETEFKIKRSRDGHIREIYSVGEYNPENNTLTGTIQDITERKQAEAELQKMDRLKTIGTLAGGIAHDFNNILTGLFGSMSIAKSKLETGHPAIASIEQAEKSMDRATRLANQLLTFSKGGNPVKEDISLADIIKEVVRFHLSGSNVKPIFQSAGDLRLAKADKGQIQQVFANLTINADKAMPEGGRFHITLENADITKTGMLPLTPGKYIKATLGDNGIGIAPKHLAYIFTPYYSIHQNGSGLGLAMVYSILEKHGGHITVDSEPGTGTTFTLYLPASDAVYKPSKKDGEKKAPALTHPARVLVMDDEEMVRHIASDMLKTCSCEVKTATDGRQAVDMYKTAKAAGVAFDLVIMDMTVPGGMGGIEAMESILAVDPQAKVVVSSGYADNAALENYAQHGFADILSKPYTLGQLRDMLHRLLNA